MKKNKIAFIVLCLFCTACKSGKGIVEENIKFADKQFDYAFTCIDKTLASENESRTKNLTNPRSIEKDGSLRMVKSTDWCSGFFPGSLWYMYEYTGNKKWESKAAACSWLIEQEKWNAGTHDMGFKMYPSFGNAYRLTQDEKYKLVLLQSAKTLITRFNPKVGAIRSWDHNPGKWQYPVIIDNMLNLELLFRATQISGDSIYYRIAVSHANKTLNNHFRFDYSSYHVVNYDTITGSVISKETHQGKADESAWARGQAWGLYGFTMAYRFTKDPAYLSQAEHIAHFIFTHPNLPTDLIPYWDFNDPAIPQSPRDVSAACVIASGLYELAGYSPKAKTYKKLADKIMSHLSKYYKAKVGTYQGFLLLHSTGNYPGNDEIDVPISYADYYYLEALLRKDKVEKTRKAL
jgi:Glycosyl Hydrolase Family 88.